MRPLSAVVIHNNQNFADTLANSLRQHFRFVSTAMNYEAAFEQVQHHKTQLLVVNLESTTFDQLRKLKAEFPAMTIICTHRLADEQLWIDVLETGAADCCYESDIRAIVSAAIRHAGPSTLNSSSAVA